ncbi:related to Protein SFK1 [Saccharomycodes ludwigii]|uniref:Related to Protein SFK1 n=1 Tax=Saccharomycodes ludwigii TaxID=36035 RepID=A0A376B5P7_9ASCO|nr:hypothetical protein SCDLUD_004157 [Saccharomycodes ludwigii]KAH3899858.1 hypothetical protein SCDLUD_004157 [Saccharomycodes ludwigii]SSD59952.1 related to Protein SFK1 [Saccharomycodes ludwigii]
MKSIIPEKYKPGNYFFLVPIVAMIPWVGMLIAMLICWAVQGKPFYSFMNRGQKLAFISDIGATNLQPLFIACSAWQGLFYFLTLCCEYYQRCGRWPISKTAFNYKISVYDENNGGGNNNERVRHGLNFPSYMPFWFTKHERNVMFAACILTGIGEILLLLATIFSDKDYNTTHYGLIFTFVVLMAIGVGLNILEYMLMGLSYMKIHPLHRRFNKYAISALAKGFWLLTAIIWAICFGALANNTMRAQFEWLLAFYFCVLFIIYSIDFYLGGRYKYSKNFPYVESFQGYYKYDQWYAKTHARSANADDYAPETEYMFRNSEEAQGENRGDDDDGNYYYYEHYHHNDGTKETKPSVTTEDF